MHSIQYDGADDDSDDEDASIGWWWGWWDGVLVAAADPLDLLIPGFQGAHIYVDMK